MYFNSQCISILGLGDDEKIIEEDEDSLLGLKACLQHHIALANELPGWAEQRLDQEKNVLANLRCTIPDTHMREKETVLEMRKSIQNTQFPLGIFPLMFATLHMKTCPIHQSVCN